MLIALSIRDFVIVERLELEFEAGFTVLTGETGAGKSILIDALAFALGERAESDQVREGCARAEVAAEFRCGAPVQGWLAQFGLDDATHGADAASVVLTNVLVRRTLDASGRSRSFINGSPATLGQLRDLGELLLDVHGQHEHQSLLRAPAQQQLLDAHGGLQEQVREVADAFATWRDAARAREQAEAARDQAAADSAQLRQLVEELHRLAPEPGEWERVAAEQTRLAHGAALMEGARLALDTIAESDDAAQPRLAKTAARLEALCAFDPRLAPVLAALAGAGVQLEEACRELHHYVANCEPDEGRLAYVEERIAALHAAGRKWRTAPAQLPALLETSRMRLESLTHSQNLEQLRAAESKAAAHFQLLADALSSARQRAAENMGRDVSRAMQELAMTGARFAVRLIPTDATAGGREKAEFLVRGHDSGSARPLAKVASGGELSRIGLAISVIAATANLVPTLIFDEVDAGIGGQVAATVGRLLRELGKSRQVFCVTHLPQVASCGDHHFAVRKTSQPGGRPLSSAEPLVGNARVQEIARMLGGTEITKLTEQHAREMLTGR
ncbi:DNA repair protein RecN [Burkholderiales bacterium]|nr:DNA repair protein RecN [Burkholderiales bacterium]